MKRLRHPLLPPFAIFLSAICLITIFACTRQPSEQERIANERIATYMLKDSALTNQFAITGRGLELFDADTTAAERKPEAVIYWDEVDLLDKMLHALPIDSVVKHYLAKGEERWDANEFADLPDPPAPFVLQASEEKPLKGMRIALDPGHVGGDMEYAQFMEEKYVRIKASPDQGINEEIGFCEGNLALGTALLLAEKLRDLGAAVLLTRTVEGKNAFGGSYDDWLEGEVKRYEKWMRHHGRQHGNPDREVWKVKCAAANYIRDYEITGKDSVWWMTKATRVNIHRIPFLKAEFLERARLINHFRPHVTLIIHYNVGENNNADSDGYRRALPQNYCMAFVPGSFMKGELKEPEDRLAFAAKLLCDDIEASERLCGHVVRAHERLLGVPVMGWDDRLQYLKNASRMTPEKGVFARNLQLTRLVHGTLCFGESLYQDNVDEAKRLNAKDYVLPGMKTPLPNRIREVADAYLEGLMAWLKDSKKAGQ